MTYHPLVVLNPYYITKDVRTVSVPIHFHCTENFEYKWMVTETISPSLCYTKAKIYFYNTINIKVKRTVTHTTDWLRSNLQAWAGLNFLWRLRRWGKSPWPQKVSLSREDTQRQVDCRRSIHVALAPTLPDPCRKESDMLSRPPQVPSGGPTRRLFTPDFYNSFNFSYITLWCK